MPSEMYTPKDECFAVPAVVTTDWLSLIKSDGLAIYCFVCSKGKVTQQDILTMAEDCGHHSDSVKMRFVTRLEWLLRSRLLKETEDGITVTPNPHSPMITSCFPYEHYQPSRKMSLISMLLERDKCRCHYCDQEVCRREAGDTAWQSKRNLATVDHIVPRCEGGTDALENLVLCCFRCNSAKSNLDYVQFLYRSGKVVAQG